MAPKLIPSSPSRTHRRKRVKINFPAELDAADLRSVRKAVVGISLPTPGKSSVGSVFITEAYLETVLEKIKKTFHM